MLKEKTTQASAVMPHGALPFHGAEKASAHADDEDIASPVRLVFDAGRSPHQHDVACYIADMVFSLRDMAQSVNLKLLSDLLEVAGEEARYYCDIDCNG